MKTLVNNNTYSCASRLQH